jgi:hypothetical protein
MSVHSPMGVWVNISFIGEFQPLDDKKNEKKSRVTHTKELCWENLV